MCDDDVIDTLFGELGNAARHGRVESDAGMPENGCSVTARPIRDFFVIACNVHRKLAGGSEHTIGRPMCERSAVFWCEHR